MSFFANLFQAESWPPRWYCGQWTDFHGWLYILSDLCIWLSYFMIPAMLLYFIMVKSNVPFHRIFVLFISFILACGLTHLMDAILFWWPAYRLSALIRFGTAGISLATVYMLYKILPQAVLLKSPEQLERMVEQRTSALKATKSELEQANEELRHQYEEAELKIQFRTQELNQRISELEQQLKQARG